MGIVKSDHGLLAFPLRRQWAAVEVDPERSRYTYLFPDLANRPGAGLFPDTCATETLARLQEFVENYYPPEGMPPQIKMDLPALYTYFGQFMNHDISAPVGGAEVDLGALAPAGVIGADLLPDLASTGRAASITPILDHLANEHAYPLSLTSLYAYGPGSADAEVNALYQPDGMRFHLARTVTLPPDAIGQTTQVAYDVIDRRIGAHDVPRTPEAALIADLRNDENLIISQMHLAFMLLHNKAVDLLHPQVKDPAACFAAARHLVTMHYQWCILNDYLPKLLSEGVLDQVLHAPPRLTVANQVPLEFSTAAFRFGHSMVGSEYDFNANFGKLGRISQAATLGQLFGFTSNGQMAGQGVQLPDHWVIDWGRLSHISGTVGAEDERGSRAEKLDLNFANDMFNLQEKDQILPHRSIFLRNLLRGYHRRMPFGQDLARAYGLPVLTPAEVSSAIPQRPAADTPALSLRQVTANLGMLDHTPAWLYILCESQVREGGERLGPTASHIIADTIVGLLKLRPNTVLTTGPRPWSPHTSPLKGAGGAPLTSLRSLMECAVDGTPNA
jgi:hypothetical protein